MALIGKHPAGFQRDSLVTLTEDVSYVGNPCTAVSATFRLLLVFVHLSVCDRACGMPGLLDAGCYS